MTKQRCSWVGKDPLYQAYHDKEWGVPNYNSQSLFAKLCLEGQQAGLSWITVLKKRANYERLFFNFDPNQIIELTESDIDRLMLDTDIIRNRLKINSIIKNAKSYLKIEQNEGDFSNYIWQFTNGQTLVNHWQEHSQIPATSSESDKMAKDLKKRGFSFVGSTICYAFMQSMGMINDHTTDCFRHAECLKLSEQRSGR